MSELGDLLELMHTARGRYRSLRMAIRVWEDPAAVMAAAAGTRGVPTTDAPPAPAEREDRIWYSAPARARLEAGPSPGGGRMVSVTDGPVRISRIDGAPAVRSEVDRFGEVAFGEHGPLLDPSQLPAIADIEVVGRAVAAGRDGIVARARIRGDVDPYCAGRPQWVDELEIVVDAECGVLLLEVARGGGRVLRVTEVTGIEVDGYIPPDRFTYIPGEGERVHDAEDLYPRPEAVTLREAVARADFTVLAPTVVQGRSAARVEWYPGDPGTDGRPAVNMHFEADDGPARWVGLWMTQAAEPQTGLELPEGEPVERDGVTFRVADRGGQVQLSLAREGTRVLMVGTNLERETLVEIATSLVPVEPDAPGLGPPAG